MSLDGEITKNELEATNELRTSIEEINRLILEQGYFLYPALTIPEYGRFTVKITSPYNYQTKTFQAVIEEDLSTPTQKYFALKEALEQSVQETGQSDTHIIYVEIGETTIALRVGKLSAEA